MSTVVPNVLVNFKSDVDDLIFKGIECLENKRKKK